MRNNLSIVFFKLNKKYKTTFKLFVVEGIVNLITSTVAFLFLMNIIIA